MTSITQLLSPWPVSKHSIVLREQHYPAPPLASMQDSATDNMQHSPSSPNDPNHNDNVTGSAESDGGGENNTDGRKGYGKRELSTSKRAAQNRAAQRAFRQRKEGYIKKLEEQVKDYQVLCENFKAVQSENYQLRDYIIQLQSRLLDSQQELPPPPSNVDGLQPGKAGGLPLPQQQAGTLPRISELGAVGQAADAMQLEPTRSGYPDPTYSEATSIKRARTASSSDMTPSQAALQGPAILSQQSQPPTASR